MKVVVTYWNSPKSRHSYVDDDVIRLYDQLDEHVSDLEFITYADDDYDIPGTVKRLEWESGYWSAVECYREPGPFMHIGLDTVIRGNIDDLPFDKLRSTQSKQERKPNVGVVLVPAKPNTIVDDFKFDSQDMPHIRRYIEDTLPQERFASYKWGPWQTADIVYFHGQPKPRDVQWLQ